MARVIVIGGGAAGLMAAARAAELGARVLLVEKTHQLGSKLRLTGGGHANVTHTGTLDDLLSHIPVNGALARNAIATFDNSRLRALLADLGQPTYADPAGRVFPCSRNAHLVAKALRTLCLKDGVQFRYDSPVRRILFDGDRVCGVLTDREINGGAVVLAAGGASYPETGSDGSGYGLAREAGHTVTPLRPGLCALYSRGVTGEGLQGLRIPKGALVLVEGGRETARVRGDLLFTDKGLTGPAIHNLSLHLTELDAGPTACLSFAPDVAAAETVLRRGIGRSPNRPWVALLPDAVPQRLGRYLGRRARIRLEREARSLSSGEVRRVADLLWRLPFAVTGRPSLERATVTVGGVVPDQVDAATLASRRVGGLYFCGEILDVTGESGGYNLQVAFGTGHLAGESAAHRILSEDAA